MDRLSGRKSACFAFLLCATTAIGLRAQTFATLYSFDGLDGAHPSAGLIQATDGNLYGTTQLDGNNGAGTVFKINAGGTLTTLYSFCSQTGCADGEYPLAALVEANNGNFYGTTSAGGAYGYGTVFAITPSGTLTTLYSFCSQSNCADGEGPGAGMVQATNGDLYGTTELGGASDVGTVFKITVGGTLTTLHSFCSLTNCTDGAYPYAGLMQAADGDLYGTTSGSGANGYGTIFTISPNGTLTTLYSFCSQSGCADGGSPTAGLVRAGGNFYGTTNRGGIGTVFEITPSGTLTTLYSFCSQKSCTDGYGPNTGLVPGTDGNFYGTTYFGGANGSGTAFEITPGGVLTTLYSFCSLGNCADGANPSATLLQDTDGSFYGTTYAGGNSSTCSNDCGSVFNLSVSLGPFVKTQPTSGAVGRLVKILGTNLTGATSVTFNGTAAVFKVVSSSEIGAAVPTAATSGTVRVVTPGGTLSSNVPFRVQP